MKLYEITREINELRKIQESIFVLEIEKAKKDEKYQMIDKAINNLINQAEQIIISYL